MCLDNNCHAPQPACQPVGRNDTGMQPLVATTLRWDGPAAAAAPQTRPVFVDSYRRLRPRRGSHSRSVPLFCFPAMPAPSQSTRNHFRDWPPWEQPLIPPGSGGAHCSAPWLGRARRAKPKSIIDAPGHASVAFTMDVHSHIIDGMQEDAMALLAWSHTGGRSPEQ